MGPQGQVDPEDKTVLSRVAHQAVDDLHRMGEILMVGNAAAPLGVAGRFAVLRIHIDQVDVAGHVELASAELAHTDHPQGHRLAIGRERCAMAAVQFAARMQAGLVERELGQFRHGAGDVGQRSLGFAIEPDQPLHDQLAQHAQGGRGIASARLQCGEGLRHGLFAWRSGRQQGQVLRVAAVQALKEAGVPGQVGRDSNTAVGKLSGSRWHGGVSGGPLHT